MGKPQTGGGGSGHDQALVVDGQHGVESQTVVQSGDDLVVVTSTKGGGDLEPIHIHKGTCANLNPVPTYPLTTLKDGDSVSVVKGVKLSDLLAGTYAVNVHKSTSDIPTYVACGDIKAPSAMGSHM